MQLPPIIPTASFAVLAAFILLLTRGAFAANADGKTTDESHAADTNPPAIKIDDAHKMINQPKEIKPASYVILASDAIILDAAGYRFDIPSELKDTPLNSIQLIQSKTQHYELEWRPGTTLYHLDKTTLKPRPGSPPFTGFKKGDHVVIAVGVVFAPGKFGPVWASTIKVE